MIFGMLLFYGIVLLSAMFSQRNQSLQPLSYQEQQHEPAVTLMQIGNVWLVCTLVWCIQEW